MNTRTVRLLLILGVFLAGLVLFSTLVLIVGGRNPVTGVLSPAAIGGPFQLVDQDGRAVSEQDFKGKPFLVFFGFTHCPEICPAALFEMSEVLHKLGPDAERVNVLFITVDPERDTPAVLKDYLSSFEPQMRGLTGDSAAIAAAEKVYRVYAKKVPLEGGEYTMDHSVLVYLMNKEGRFVAPFNLKRRPEDSAAELRRYF
jgi:protein SCO1/2